jgi:transcriptional regulator with XRE-family HTH domain
MSLQANKEIGKRLRELRREKSQSQFAKEIRVPLRSYKRYESGGTMPPLDVVQKIADIYGNITVLWLVTGERIDVSENNMKTFSLPGYQEGRILLERICREGNPQKIEAALTVLHSLYPVHEVLDERVIEKLRPKKKPKKRASK